MIHVRRLKATIVTCCMFLCVAVHAGDMRAEFAVSIEATGPVRYLGLVDRDDAGLTAQSDIQYGAAGLGLAGALLTMALHGAAIDTRRTQQSRRLQEISESIAAPHNEALSELLHGDLLRDLALTADAALRPWRVAPGATRLVRSRPVFGVSEDATTLVIENLVQISENAASPPIFSTLVRVVRDHEQPGGPIAEKVAVPLAATSASGPTTSTTPVVTGAPIDAAYALRLRRATHQLFAESIDLALRDAMREFTGHEETARTFRYVQGGVLKFERGQKISATCEHVILRNLHGGITSLPLPGATRVERSDCPRNASAGQ